MTDWEQVHVAVVANMVRVPVTGSHHKQKQTIVGWCGGYEGDTVKQAIDDLVTDPQAPVHEKGRRTITLTSVQAAKDFIRENDDEDEYTWYL